MADVQKKYRALVLHPEVEARLRLKGAAVSMYQFGEVHLAGTTHEALGRLQSERDYDVVFVSEKYPQPDLVEFIKSGKESPRGRDAAYVLLLPPAEDESGKIATSMMLGADGVLVEPWSVDVLLEITELAAKVRRENVEAREKAAITFLVKDIIKQIDRLAYIKACAFDVGRTLKQFRDMCSVFQTFDEASMRRYYEIVIDLFEQAPLPKLPPVQQYRGGSSRVKKLMEKKLLDHWAGETVKNPDKKEEK